MCCFILKNERMNEDAEDKTKSKSNNRESSRDEKKEGGVYLMSIVKGMLQ